ncbi:MAG: AAA family ATPase [candidate division Zixibacteria bacterium]|nr:AAA family ATPase [candidate division Zixibacteria bacterium]
MPTDFKSLQLKAGIAFSPAAPIDKYSLFSGRLDELTRLIDAITGKGQHAITYGERGVGKTSLANILHEVLKNIGREDVLVTKINCDTSDNFSNAWRKALREIVHISEYPTVGFEPETKQIVMDLSSGLGKVIVPNDIIKAFKRTKKSMVFIFDEFDRIQNNDTDRNFADTMKALSDYGIDGTLVLVGVGDAVDDLIKSHESIVRSLIQVRIPRMTVDELNGILDKGLKELSMEIDDDARERIVILSQGLPHYTHLLGREAVRVCLRSEQIRVTLPNVNKAIEQAVKDAQQTVTSDYQKATSSSHKGHLYKEVLLACALVKGDDLGYFSLAEIRTPLSRIKGKPFEIGQYAQHLANFCTEGRANVLSKIGDKYRHQYRFNNPILRQYVIIRGFMDELLTEDMIDLMPIWTP